MLFEEIVAAFEEQQDTMKAAAMKAYMKNQFEFFGVSAPNRKEILRAFKQKHSFKLNVDFWTLVDQLWQTDQRELQYLAIDIMTSLAKKMTFDDIARVENMVISKSWWDTVDGLAPNIIGTIFLKDRAASLEHVYRWMDSDNMWLNRTAIIHQLRYGKLTYEDLLLEAILKHDTSKEFFIRKAQGWALRQYSKYNPQLVINFIEANPQLSGLTKKEALRSLKM